MIIPCIRKSNPNINEDNRPKFAALLNFVMIIVIIRRSYTLKVTFTQMRVMLDIVIDF